MNDNENDNSLTLEDGREMVIEGLGDDDNEEQFRPGDTTLYRDDFL